MTKPFDPRVVDALYLVVAAIVSSLSEEQRAHAHEQCGICLSNPDMVRMFGVEHPESEACFREIVDRVFTGRTPLT